MHIISADEPGQHSAQNEQDNRNYAKSAKIPMFEPANSQECRDMVLESYKLIEEYDTPSYLARFSKISVEGVPG